MNTKMGMTAIIPTGFRKLGPSRDDWGDVCLPFFFSFKDKSKNHPTDLIYYPLECFMLNLGGGFVEPLQITIKG
ncbi:MAG: hypothetical protein H3Z50_08310 [archaeon]|nr:hypothetical protein [archaeon]